MKLQDIKPDEWYQTGDVAKVLGLARRTLTGYVRDGMFGQTRRSSAARRSRYLVRGKCILQVAEKMGLLDEPE